MYLTTATMLRTIRNYGTPVQRAAALHFITLGERARLAALYRTVQDADDRD